MMRDRRVFAIALAMCVSACVDRPSSIIICHNSNCAAPTNPNLDDTMQALRQSLALTWNDAPLLDGTDLDTVWDVDAQRCVFAYDFSVAIAGVDAVEPALVIAQHLRDTAPAVGDRRYYVKIEQKELVAPDARPHTEDERNKHAACSLAMFDILATAATESGRNLTVLFDSPEPELVLALTQHNEFPVTMPGEQIQTGVIVPLQSNPPPALKVDIAAVNWADFHDGNARALRDLRGRGVPLMVWMYDAGVEVLSTIESLQPEFVNTGEAVLMREWMGPRTDL